MSMLTRVFQKVKQKSKRDKKQYKVVQSASFADLAGKNVELEIRVNGNNKLLSIKIENENQIEIMLDQEKSILLSVLLQSYAAHEVFPDLDEK